MFAFALWDAGRRRLLAARDRLGKKPFYYAHVGGRFAFASEMKALLTNPSIPRDVDPGALDEFLSRLCVGGENQAREADRQRERRGGPRDHGRHLRSSS